MAVWCAGWDETVWLCGVLVGVRLGGCLVCWLGWDLLAVWCACLHTRQPSIQSENYQCRIDTDVLLMMDTYLPETCREVEINILRSSVHLVGFI